MDPGLRAELYQDKAGEWRWRIHAANGRIVADSGEGYHHRADALHGLRLVTGSGDHTDQESTGAPPA